IEGMIIAAYVIGAARAFIYIRGEYDLQATRLEEAVEEARAAGYLGERILGSDHTLTLGVHRGAGAYICGEETALLDSLEASAATRASSRRSRPTRASIRARRSSTTSRRSRRSRRSSGWAAS